MKANAVFSLFFLLASAWMASPVEAETAYPVEWIRQIGTNKVDESWSVAIDGAGNAYISGSTRGNLEEINAGSSDAFLTKFDSTGTELWTRQIGSDNYDASLSVAVDGAGNAYISGYTETESSPGGINTDSFDAFLTKFNSIGTVLWTRQVGSSNYDASLSVAVDGTGNVFISGETSGDLVGTNVGNGDAFLTKFDSVGTELWTRQIGSSNYDSSSSVAVDGTGNVFISGTTKGSLGGANAGSADVFLIKFDSAGTQLWARQIGSNSIDQGLSLALDEVGNAYISGSTEGSLEGTNAGSADTFLTKFDPTGTELWTEQFGSGSRDVSRSVAVNGADVYISGSTWGNLEGANAGFGDAFLIKFTGETFVEGDYNSNGVVDTADYTLWRDTVGLTGSLLAADGNGDNVVDTDDYTYWASRFGNTTTSSVESGSVPEPTTGLLATMATTGLLFRRR